MQEQEELLKEAGIVLPEPIPESDAPSDDDAKPSILNRLSTPVSVLSDLFSGGSQGGNPTQSVSQSEVNPPALVYTDSNSTTSSTTLNTSPSIDLTVLPQFGSSNEAFTPPPPDIAVLSTKHSAKPLDKETLGRLAKKFAESVPEGEFSVAALQGYLLKHKSSPEGAAGDAGKWVIEERATKGQLERKKREREERRKRRKEKAKERAKIEKEKAKKAAAEAKKVADAAAAVAAAAVAAGGAVPATPVAASPGPEESMVLVSQPPSPPPAPPAEFTPLPPALPPAPELVAADSDSDSSDDDDEEESDEEDEEGEGSGSDSSDSDSSEDEVRCSLSISPLTRINLFDPSRTKAVAWSDLPIGDLTGWDVDPWAGVGGWDVEVPIRSPGLD